MIQPEEAIGGLPRAARGVLGSAAENALWADGVSCTPQSHPHTRSQRVRLLIKHWKTVLLFKITPSILLDLFVVLT